MGRGQTNRDILGGKHTEPLINFTFNGQGTVSFLPLLLLSRSLYHSDNYLVEVKNAKEACKMSTRINKTQFMHLSQFLPSSTAVSNLLRDVAISRSQKKSEAADN